MADWDSRSVSVRLDGKASIEHQLDIHVIDLVECHAGDSRDSDTGDVLVSDVLQGLRYVMDYRIKGGKMPKLDLGIMRRLAEGLLQITGRAKSNLFQQLPTEDADLAFFLFGDFIAEVDEFRLAVAEFSASDLRHALKLHRRCQPRSTSQQREACAALLGLLTFRFPQFSDWRELVKEGEHDDVEDLMREYPLKFSAPAMPLASVLLPPPGSLSN